MKAPRRNSDLNEGDSYEVGQVITVADFEAGKKLDVTGVSKGKGTQGNIKRHGHHRGPMSHGSKHKRLAGAAWRPVLIRQGDLKATRVREEGT